MILKSVFMKYGEPLPSITYLYLGVPSFKSKTVESVSMNEDECIFSVLEIIAK